VLTQTQKKPEGLLRISAPVILGQEAFYAFLSSFLKTYPGIQIDLFITNLFLDLIVENIDVAIRFGELPDSSLIAQHVGKSVRYVVAAPEYLHGRLPPSRPEDLRQHQCVLLQARNNEAEWHLVSGKRSIKLHVSGPVAARDFHAVKLSNCATLTKTAMSLRSATPRLLHGRKRHSRYFRLIEKSRLCQMTPHKGNRARGEIK
jgi:DNA-binding transcriptional LysR family regulator